MKTISRIAWAAAAFSLAVAPAIVVADTEPSKPKDHGEEACKCQRRHESEHGRGDTSGTKPASSSEVPEWVRQTWTSP